MYAILSDIHGNMTALERVVEDMRFFEIDGIILLGDLIDYGMQSNEVVEYIRLRLQDKVICSIWGNHERAILTSDFGRFSSRRGAECARHTASRLSGETRRYLSEKMNHEGLYEFELGGQKSSCCTWFTRRPVLEGSRAGKR